MIALYGAKAGSNELLRLDDRSVATDEGDAMDTPFFIPSPLEVGAAGGRARLRQVAQAVSVTDDEEVTITPIADGAEASGQAEVATLDVSQGPTQIVEAFPALDGHRFTVRVEVTGLLARPEFGECTLMLVPRRSTANV